MKIALIGYGKMGKQIELLAPLFHSEVVLRLTSQATENDWKLVENVDVCIDFSTPQSVLENIKKVAKFHKPMVVGTTGWNSHLSMVQKLVETKNIGLIYAANFSIGLNLFLKIVEKAAVLMNPCEEFDIAISEVHHKEKLDAPSGTALMLGDAILNRVHRKTSLSVQTSEKLSKKDLSICSQRVGFERGTHSVTIDSENETITLAHQVRDRSVWAKGALKAAQWIIDRRGIYTLNDMLEVPCVLS
ncbi:MAG: 4-hydroxy-tetrahydrodipicolinate reductase [Chlamydiae bacterium]|nr:4-hydroxy-tetrahydrodipicolinate reductase [Chlamydiota bacterium]